VKIDEKFPNVFRGEFYRLDAISDEFRLLDNLSSFLFSNDEFEAANAVGNALTTPRRLWQREILHRPQKNFMIRLANLLASYKRFITTKVLPSSEVARQLSQVNSTKIPRHYVFLRVRSTLGQLMHQKICN
jgi:hypothetical protein